MNKRPRRDPLLQRVKEPIPLDTALFQIRPFHSKSPSKLRTLANLAVASGLPVIPRTFLQETTVFLADGQRNPELGSPWLRFEFNDAIVMPNQPASDIEPQPDTLSLRLGRKERIKDSLANMCGGPGTIVDDAPHNTLRSEHPAPFLSSDIEPQPDTLSLRLGRKERIKDSLANMCGDPGTIVDDAHYNTL